MFSLNFIVAFGLLAGIALGQDVVCSGNEIVTYPIPAGVTTNPSFNVSVKSPDGRWIVLDLYLVTLNLINTTTGGSGIHDSSLAYFDFCGSVEISATFNGGSIDNATIRPDSYGIVPIISGGSNLKFTINKPQNLVIEVNGDIFNVVHLLSNTIETDIPAANATDVMYFGPGLHKVTGGLVSVPSNTTVYIAGGGVLNAELTFQNISNSVLRGRGVVYHASGHSILIENSTNIRVQDVISLNPGHYAIQAGEANGLTISNFRGFSSVGNGDGIDLFCCQNTLIDGVFMRNSDDNIAIYSHRYNYYGNTSNITVQNSSLWADVAHPIVIGTHGNTDDPETMSGITITNIDILDHREMQVDYQGCIALNPGDENLIENVYIDDIRVENFRLGQLVNMRVMFNTMYNTSPGRGISNVTIKNLNYTGTNAKPAIFVGYDETRTISNVTFEDLVINGQQISDTMPKPSWYLTSDYVPMYQNEHVINLLFKST